MAEPVRDDTGDLRLGAVRATMWLTLASAMMHWISTAWVRHFTWPVMIAEMLPVLPLVLLLADPARRPRPFGLAALLLAWMFPFALFGTDWDWAPWPLAVAALCVFRGRTAWSLFGLVIGGTAAVIVTFDVPFTRFPDPLSNAIWAVFMPASIGIAVFGTHSMATMATRLHTTRGELALLKAREERLRADSELRRSVGDGLRGLEVELAAAVLGADPREQAGHLEAAAATGRRISAEIRGTAGAYRVRPAAPPAVESPAVARYALAGLFLSMVPPTLNNVHVEHLHPWLLIPTALVTCAVGSVLLLTPPSRRRTLRLGLLVLPPSAIAFRSAATAPLLVLLPFYIGVLLDQVRARYRIPIVTTAYGLFVVLWYTAPWPALLHRSIPSLIEDVTLGFMVIWATYSLARLSELFRLLHQARADLVAATVLAERTRIARDLHDVLSFTVSAIVLKAELCARLLSVDPAAAKQQLAELPPLAATALGELEALVKHEVPLRFTEELANARTVLRNAGVDVKTVIESPHCAAGLDSALAAVLREAVTNVIKHSHARTCSITLLDTPGTVHLRVVNDGVAEDMASGPTAASDPSAAPGSGLLGMAERADGRLIARRLAGGRFELAAEFTKTSGACTAKVCARTAA
ncbi:sensor histidine kinase [Catenulispora subtropica]|uniref:Signal transduction histidine kinase subgroup 3 dimerisation and phosphoacceptor domain-containing protein n=1 Tax=Catenulispora subtropica TaxID=450798 RepID=A0ABN2R9A7_9ACTN